MSNIFENDSDPEVEISTNNEYAKNYNIWRKKEEINKLKTKYGDDVDVDEISSSSSSDDEDGVELTEEIEKDFFKTLSCLINKDPSIYNENVKFFEDKHNPVLDKKKRKKESTISLKDFERKTILEKGGILSDEENTSERRSKSTNVEELEAIKQNIKNVVDQDDDEEFLNIRKKSQEEKDKEESDYKKWFTGEKDQIDKEVETKLKPLKDYWNKPDLNEEEKFLRDYFLHNKFLDKDEQNHTPTYEEVIHDSDQDLSNDEETIERQEQFEYKYNFRFEEPDQEFIKRYPRTMENSIRKTDDRRKIKRQEAKERKKKEKEEKMQELKKLQELKRKEIEEKLEKLKEITGNTDVGFENEDIDGDFDPEAHDKRMQTLFNDNFYDGTEEEQKPVFPDLDEELEIENWDRYEHENEEDSADAPHCEDDDFNMDCDYDSKASIQHELIEKSKGKKKRKRKSKVAEALSKPKPKLDSNDKNYEKYFDEYYKLDCEDIIGDIPCRFKYRQVVPNDFGLSIEEILLAKERELNKWCSLKKAVQIRPENVEKYDQIAYKKKAQNINLKKKILPSLFTPDPEEQTSEPKEENKAERESVSSESKDTNDLSRDEVSKNNDAIQAESNFSNSNINKAIIKKKKKKQKNSKQNGSSHNNANGSNSIVTNSIPEKEVEGSVKSKVQIKSNPECRIIENRNQKQGQKRKASTNREVLKKKFKNVKQNKTKELAISDARLSAYGINPKKFKNKVKYGKK